MITTRTRRALPATSERLARLLSDAEQARRLTVPAAAALLLVGTAALPTWPLPAALAASVAATALAVTMLRPSAIAAVAARRPAPGRRMTRASLAMLLQLSPVALLTFVFPVAVGQMGDAAVAGVDLPTLLLASSLTVPWLSMAVCLPLYRAIGPYMSAGDVDGVRRRLSVVWPSVFVQALPVVAVFGAVVQAVMRWPLAALLTYLALSVLHVAFAQSLVMANVKQDRVLWAQAWVAYAVALLVAPTWWFLPPLVATATQLFPLRRELAAVRRVEYLDHRDVLLDLIRGLLLGSVLWSHLFVIYLAGRGHMAVITLFIAVLPAVIAYNYYFVRLAPRFDEGVARLRTAMEHSPHAEMSRQSAALAGTVTTTLARTGLAGASIAFVVTWAISSFTDLSAALTSSVAVASWLFLMITVACYKLDYIGQVVEAQLLSAAHLVVVAVVLTTMPAGAAAYAWLVALEAVVLAAAVARCLGHWRSSEYALFWRHATAW